MPAPSSPSQLEEKSNNTKIFKIVNNTNTSLEVVDKFSFQSRFKSLETLNIVANSNIIAEILFEP